MTELWKCLSCGWMNPKNYIGYNKKQKRYCSNCRTPEGEIRNVAYVYIPPKDTEHTSYKRTSKLKEAGSPKSYKYKKDS